MNKFLYAVLLTTPWILSGQAIAGATGKDLEVSGNVLSFIANPPAATVKVGIVYQPGNAVSAKDEQSLMALLGSGHKFGDFTFIPTAIELDKLDGASPDILFVTEGLGAADAKVGSLAKAKKILCMTTDLSAVQAGLCAVGIQTSPSVKIIVNRAAAADSGITFQAAFKMMISEL